MTRRKVKSSRTKDGYHRREFDDEGSRRTTFSVTQQEAREIVSELPEKVADRILKNYSVK